MSLPRSLASFLLLPLLAAAGCAAEPSDTSADTALELSHASLGGAYSAAPSKTMFFRDDSEHVWDFFTMSI